VRLAAGLPAGSTGPEPAALGPEVLAPGESAPSPNASDAALRAPVLSRVRISGRPRICSRRRGCQARPATVSFRLAVAADVTVRLRQRRPCRGGRCGWRPARSIHQRQAQGRTRWSIGRRLLGMRLRPGVWQLTLGTTAGSVQRTFRVR
jgi:hypothetical protein